MIYSKDIQKEINHYIKYITYKNIIIAIIKLLNIKFKKEPIESINYTKYYRTFIVVCFNNNIINFYIDTGYLPKIKIKNKTNIQLINIKGVNKKQTIINKNDNQYNNLKEFFINLLT